MKNHVLLILCFIFALNSGCRPEARRVEQPAVIFTDSAGRQVEVPAVINRVAPSGSTAQMFLLAIAPDLLCAVAGAYTAEQAEFIPAYVRELPAIGQFYGSRDLNPEVVAGIAPDVVIDVGEPKDTVGEDMDGISAVIDVPALHITATLQSSPDAFRILGRLLHREEKGEALAGFCEKALRESGAAMEKAEQKPSLLYCLGPAGTNVLAAGSFHSEVIDWLADNKAVVNNPASRGSGNEVGPEQILLWDPEIIILAPDSVIYESAASDPVWSKLRAVQNRNYFRVPLGPYNWMGSPPSINRYPGMLWLANILYAADYDLYAETAEYYKLFYGYELSRERYAALTQGGLR